MQTQPLSFPIRLPDTLQAEALRLLDESRSAINQLLLVVTTPSARAMTFLREDREDLRLCLTF